MSLLANIFKDLKHCHKVHYSWRAFNQAIFLQRRSSYDSITLGAVG